MDLTFLGTNTLLIKKGQSRILIDPHFTRPGLLNLLCKIKPDREKIRLELKNLGINRLDGVLLTHTHYDHAMDAAEVICQVGGVLYGSASAANLAVGAGLSKDEYHIVEPNNRDSIGEFSVTWLESRHVSFPPPFRWLMKEKGQINHPLSPPLYFWDYQSGAVYAILIDDLLVFGSAGYKSDAYKSSDVKTVVLSIGGMEIKHHNYLERLYQQTVIQTGARQILVSHWDNFFMPLSQNIQTLGLANMTIQRLKQLGAHYGEMIKVLFPGESIEI